METNRNFDIIHSSDVIWPDAICIPINYDLDLLTSFEIEIGSNRIWQIPFYLLMKISKITVTKDHHIIKIPLNMFFEEQSMNMPVLPMIALQFHAVRMKLLSKRSY